MERVCLDVLLLLQLSTLLSCNHSMVGTLMTLSALLLNSKLPMERVDLLWVDTGQVEILTLRVTASFVVAGDVHRLER